MSEKIFILHGWAIDKNNEAKWQSFRDLLSKKNIESVFLPFPGLSQPMKTSDVWGLDDYVSWTLQQLPKTPVILVAHSFGGQVAIRLAAQYPERLKKLVLIDSAGIIDRRWQKVIKRNVFFHIAKIGKKALTLLPQKFSQEFFTKALYKLVGEHDYQKADSAMKQVMKKVIQTEVLADLPKIQCSTLILWGSEDTMTPLFMGEIMRDLIKKNTFQQIALARHCPQFSHPEVVAKRIEDFIKK